MDFVKALQTALTRVATFRSADWNKTLRDVDVSLWVDTALLYALEKQLEGCDIKLSVEMFHPYCDQQYQPEESLFMVHTTPSHIQTPLGIFVESMLSNMADEFTPQLTDLLNKYSPRCGHPDKRPVVSCEIKQIVSCVDSETLKAFEYVLRHLSAVIAEQKIKKIIEK